MAKLDAQHLKDQTIAVIEVCRAYRDLIKAATENSSLRGIPSGHLYAMVMSSLSLDDHNHIVQLLVDAHQIRVDNHLLIYVGQ